MASVRRSSSWALAGGLVTTCLLAFATAAHSASGSYHGKTSQGESVSFELSGGYLRRLDFRIDDTCPNGHVWRIHDFNFPPIEVARGRFDQTFRSTDGRATAEVKGRALRRKVTGTLTDRSYIRREHRYCRGTATFRLHRQASVTAPLRRLRAHDAGTTMPVANEWPAGPQNTSKSRRSWIPDSVLTAISNGPPGPSEHDIAADS